MNDTRLLTAQADALVARLGPLAGITSDSRMAAPEIAFAAYPGGARDGRAFIGDAIARGAAAVLFEARGFDCGASPGISTNGAACSVSSSASMLHPSSPFAARP